MKKTTIIFVFILLLFTICFCTNVYAADSDVATVSVSKKEVDIGDTFVLSINVDCESEFDGLTGTLEYDKTKLELVSYTVGNGLKDLNAEDADGIYNISVFKNTTGSVKKTVCESITFKVLSGATAGEDIEIKLVDAVVKEEDKTTDDITLTTKVSVKKAATTPGTTPSQEDNNKSDSKDKTAGGSSDTSGKTTSKDSTTAKKSIDKAGAKKYSFIIMGSLVIGIISFIFLNKYRNI